MNQDYHIPVMLAESIKYLNIKSDGIYCDFTLGGAGHFSAIAEKLNKNGTAIGIDRDSTAVNLAKNRDFQTEANIIIEQNPFSHFDEVLTKYKISKIDGILMDLGVSSHQFDTGERGFSYRSDARLDMRMNRNDLNTAENLINYADEDEITKIFNDFGEIKNPQRMARKIVSARKNKKIETTGEFIAVLNEEYGQLHNSVLSKIFQAFRIAVNNELDELQNAMQKSLDYLNPGGRIVVISYHSLEDRIVKNFLRNNSQNCICPAELPKCICGGKSAKIKLVTKKSIEPKDTEILENRRARSAKLRCGEKI